MPKKITYLLGAGASANALPTIKGIGKKLGLSDSMRELSKTIDNMLKRNDSNGDYNIKQENEEIAKTFSRDLKSLADESDKFVTVDTLAKYYNIMQKKVELDNLKKTLSIYFAAEQIQKKFDSRYIVFLTSILRQDKIFPENIKIITWNYDFQMQLASQKFFPEESGKRLVHYYPNDKKFNIIENTDFNLVHLNGIAGYTYLDNGNINKMFLSTFNLNKFFELLANAESNKHLITFAWEKGYDTEQSHLLSLREKTVSDVIVKTEILIVIGYSFPFFNREMDNKIFKTLKEGNLKKIYFQDPSNDGKFLKNQFDLASDIEIEHIDKVDNFFLPLEL